MHDKDVDLASRVLGPLPSSASPLCHTHRRTSENVLTARSTGSLRKRVKPASRALAGNEATAPRPAPPRHRANDTHENTLMPTSQRACSAPRHLREHHLQRPAPYGRTS
jgi:hypothetical protein